MTVYGRVLAMWLILLILLAGDIEKCPGPWKKNDFSIAHQNICGLSGKIDLLSLYVLNNEINIFGVTETFLTDKIPSSLVNIDSYNFERKDRKAAGGGVAVYVKNCVNYVRRNDLESEGIELICLEIIPVHTKSFFVSILYRPPNSSKHLCKSFSEKFNELLHKMNEENKEIIIIGDINCNYLDNTNNKDIKELLALNGFIQVVKEPTRVTDTTQTLIDVILTTKPENLCDIKVIQTAMSDHDAIGCKRKLNNKKQLSEEIKCRDYSKYEPNNLRNDLSNESFHTIYAAENPNEAWKSLKSILETNFNRHAPQITKRVKAKKSPWLTREIKAEMNHRDTLQRKFRKSKSTEDYNKFKEQRNRVNILVRKTKAQYNQNLLKESSNDPNRFWSAINKIFPTKEKVSAAKTFLVDNKLTTNVKTIASSFCSFFTNVASNLKSKVAPLKDFVWGKPKETLPKTYSTFKFREVKVNEVFKHLKSLSQKKATGSDELPNTLLKDSACQIAKPLCHVINRSLASGIFPEDFKDGLVTPVFKSGKKEDMDNYRPITVLPACSKILEKCIHSQLMEFLEERKLLSPTQFGFRKKRNTEYAATLLLDQIRENTDSGKLTGAVFIDLSKAFDTLGHGQILESLSSYGITGKEKDLFTNYLFGRKQSVRVGKEISPPQPVVCGVPQGSILGPLLFLLTFNDIGSVLRYSKIITYADDTVIYVSDTSKEIVQKNLQEDFHRVIKWLDSMDLVTNLKKVKTECMLFGTTQKLKNKTLEIKSNFDSISNTSTYKYLGVKLDETLSLREHIESVYKKASARLYLLKRIRPNLTTDVALTVYKTMLIPIFTYCSIITGNYTQTVESKIINFERKAYDIIFQSQQTKRSKLIKIRELQRKRICVQVFKCMSGSACENFNDYFEVMTNNTRNKNNLIRLPKIKLQSTKKSFRFTGAKIFNELPLDIREAETLNVFNQKYNKIFNV